jgi:O-antigen ligase
LERQITAEMESTTISVVMPTRNRAGWLRKAIQSVLSQTYKNFKLIIVDDASTDDTEHVLRVIEDERVWYVRHDQHRGSVAARNTGIRVARGTYIAFLYRLLADTRRRLRSALGSQGGSERSTGPDCWSRDGGQSGSGPPLAVAMLILAATLAGVLTVTDKPGAVVFGVSVVASLLIAQLFRRPQLGLLLLVTISPLDQLQRVPGVPFLNATKVLGMVVAVSWILHVLLARGRHYRLVWTGLEIPFALFVFVLMLRVFPSDDLAEAIAKLTSVASYAVLYVVVVNLVRDRRSVSRLVYVLIFVSVLVSLLAVAQFATGSTIFPRALGERLDRGGAAIPRAVGAARNPNLGAFLPVLVFPLSMGGWLSENDKGRRLVFGLASLCILVGAAVMMSRSAYLAIVLETGILVLVLRRRVPRLGPVLAFGISLVVMSMFLPLDLIITDRFRSIVELDVGQRFEIYRGTAEMFADHPLLGVGLGNFKYRIAEYTRFGIAPHNNLISVLGETGLLGLVAFAWLSLAPICCLWGRLQQKTSRHWRPLLAGFLASIVGYQVNGLFHTSFVWVTYWLVLSMGMATVSIVRRHGGVTPQNHGV